MRLGFLLGAITLFSTFGGCSGCDRCVCFGGGGGCGSCNRLVLDDAGVSSDGGRIDAPFDAGWMRPDVPFETIDAPHGPCDYSTPGVSIGSMCGVDDSCAGALTCIAPIELLLTDDTVHPWGAQMCSEPCTGDPDSCGPCARCAFDVPLGSQRLKTDPLCRPRCAPSAFDRGDCLAGFTCDPRSEVCVPACSTDADCQLEPRVTADGLRYAFVTDASLRCDLATGRCTHPGPIPAAGLGANCMDDRDCAATDECYRPTSATRGICARFACDSPGSRCDAEATCVDEGPRSTCRVACGLDSDCPEGLSCDRGSCWTTCTSSEDCESGWRCTDGSGSCSGDACFCRFEPPSEDAGVPDADVPDAGVLDAGELDAGVFDAGI